MRRKHLGCHFFACDWTGVPLKNNKFYLPFFRSGKWVKYGHYLNWQCAAAHAYYLSETSQISNLHDTLMQLNEVAGYEVQAAPHFSELSHFGGELSVCQFKKKSMHRSDTLTAILINEQGEAQEVQLPAVDGSHVSSIYGALNDHRFDEIELTKKSKLGKDVHVMMLTNLQSTADINTSTAIKGVGVNIAGKVIMTCCKGPRIARNYSHLTMEDFKVLSGAVPPKKKPPAPTKCGLPAEAPPVQAMSKAEFNKIAAEMKRGMAEIDTSLEDVAAVPPKKRSRKTVPTKKPTAA